jgi:uncharacterized RDD family membrane protein YckC
MYSPLEQPHAHGQGQPPAFNPYSPPAATGFAATSFATSEDEAPFPASAGRRFGNYIIDGIVVTAVAIGIASLRGLAGSDFFESMVLGLDMFTQIAAYGIAYVLPEAVFGRTFGKLCTGTKVVNLQGGNPSFGQVIARTAIRFVPFEAFSFLWGEPVGWHDSWSKTRVVLVEEPYANV